MLNWKKEGYEVGKEVCIVNHVGFYNPNYIIKTGKVVSVGTKHLKVSINERDKEKILDFNGKQSVNGCVFGDYYLVYKSKDEYEKLVKEKEEIEDAKKYIKDNLDKLSLAKLNEIMSLIS